MKRKGKIYLLFSLFIILMIPFIVFAEECNVNDIVITSMKKINVEGNAEELDNPKFNKLNIKLYLIMKEVGDSIYYDITVKNNGTEDYYIDKNNFKTNSEYIEYSLSTNDNNNIVKAKSNKKLTLKITYKKEVDKSLLDDNIYEESNNLNLSLNTKKIANELDIITTDNIKKINDLTKVEDNYIKREETKVNNPITSTTSMKFIIAILLTTIVIIFLTIINKKKYNKYNKYLVLIISMSLIQVVYAVCKCDIKFENNIIIEHKPTLNETLIDLSKEENSCMIKYEGEVTDDVGKTIEATKVFFDKCTDKRNVIFDGFCWQVLRTTETGGTKVIYNGKSVGDKCLNTRSNTKGIRIISSSTVPSPSNYLFGDSYIYSESTNKFTILNTFQSPWNPTTYENLIGKYTCGAVDTCSNMHHINGYNKAVSKLYYALYTLEEVDYASIGISPFNVIEESPAMVGYRFNKTYYYKKKTPQTNTYMYGNSFTYDENTNIYTLSGTTKTISDWSTGYTKINNTHYTCWNEEGSCQTISFIYNSSNAFVHYIDINDGKSINDAINEMLSNDEVNKNDSSVKGLIDGWYYHNLIDKTDKLEDAVYCNDRSISNFGGWNKEGNLTSRTYIEFTGSDMFKLKLSCPNITDQFAVGNESAKLTYPIALVSSTDLYKLGNSTDGNSLRITGKYYKGLTPESFGIEPAFALSIGARGEWSRTTVGRQESVRPSISFKKDVKIIGGTGSETNPWILE